MNKYINIANKNESLYTLNYFRYNRCSPFFVRISNLHIKDLNKVLGRNIFKKDTVYINSETLWDIMQPVGGKGSHHYHGLTPEEVYNTLSRLRYSKQIIPSYDDRFVVITDIQIRDGLYMVAILLTNEDLYKENIDNVTIVITIYPSDRKNLLTK